MKGLSEADSKRELMAAGMYRTAPVTLVGYRVISAVSFLIDRALARGDVGAAAVRSCRSPW